MTLKHVSLARSSLLPVAFLLLFTCSPLAHAQASSVIGTVLDPAGSPVASANISAKNIETGAVRSVSTNDAGRYEILSLPVGRYEIKAAKAGFDDSLRTGIKLAIGQEAIIDFNLRVG